MKSNANSYKKIFVAFIGEFRLCKRSELHYKCNEKIMIIK